ncbi:MFS transporter [Pseudonocardia acaciae]|uniref:MFS transporter n=1 Tax=Pseudonocardia acaciae TaxID=551276 RepID=UPI000B2C2642|nr:MFS transporter [Pseudonocardia acaciae]
MNDWSAVVLTSASGASEAVASMGYFAFSVTMIGVRLVADRLTGRLGEVAVVRASVLVALAGFGLVTTVPVPWVGVVGFAVVGLGISAVVPLAWSSAGRRGRDAPGRAIAAVATCGYLGFLVGPALIGALVDRIGPRPAVAVAGLLLVPVLVLAPSMRQGSPDRRNESRSVI